MDWKRAGSVVARTKRAGAQWYAAVMAIFMFSLAGVPPTVGFYAKLSVLQALVSTNVTGTSALVGVILPLPFIARVQGTACDRLAGQLSAFLKGEDIPAEAAGT